MPRTLDTLIGEINADGTPVAAYTWGAAGLVSEHRYDTTTPQSFWYHYGPQGETRQLTNASGTVTDTYIYSDYGDLISLPSAAPDPNPFQFGGSVGYYTDPAAGGLVLCGQRWYSPRDGRWLSRDPEGYDGGANLYAYCGDNPVGIADPNGTDPTSDDGGEIPDTSHAGVELQANHARAQGMIGAVTAAGVSVAVMMASDGTARLFEELFASAGSANAVARGIAKIIKKYPAVSQQCDVAAMAIQNLFASRGVASTVVTLRGPVGSMIFHDAEGNVIASKGWHQVVIAGGRFYDALTGPQGASEAEYSARWAKGEFEALHIGHSPVNGW